MLGLALHELATNGIKHNPGGQRSITWSEVTGSEEKEWLRFIWRGTTGSPVTADTDQTGFGCKLLTCIIPQALGGQARMTVTTREVTWTLDAPRSSVGTICSPTTGDLWCSSNERDELGLRPVQGSFLCSSFRYHPCSRAPEPD